jgi:hypothetical protein
MFITINGNNNEIRREGLEKMFAEDDKDEVEEGVEIV